MRMVPVHIVLQLKWRYHPYILVWSPQCCLSVYLCTGSVFLLSLDQVQFYAFQDMLLVLHQDHFVRGCFPLHTQATMFGSYICNSSQNLNGTEEGLNYSTLNSTILQFLPSCDKAATCTTMCSSLVRACPHGQMTLSRQDICPVTISEI